MVQPTNANATAEKRRAPRIDTKNTVAYVLYDEKKLKIGSGRAFTRNLSQTGTLIQTREKIDGAFIILMSIDIEGNRVKVKGKVINSRICEKTENYLTGIEFLGPKDKQLQAVIAFVKAYQRQKYASEIRSDDLC